MSGSSKALDKLWAHETRRNGRRLREPGERTEPSRGERDWLHSLSGDELAHHVRCLTAVDRAVAAAREAAQREAA